MATPMQKSDTTVGSRAMSAASAHCRGVARGWRARSMSSRATYIIDPKASAQNVSRSTSMPDTRRHCRTATM